MNELEYEEGDAQRQNDLHRDCRQMLAQGLGGMVGQVPAKVGVFEKRQQNQVEDNAKGKPGFLLLGIALYGQAEEIVGHRHAENQQAVNRLPAHIKDIAAKQKQQGAHRPRAHPKKRDHDGQKHQIPETIEKHP